VTKTTVTATLIIENRSDLLMTSSFRASRAVRYGTECFLLDIVSGNEYRVL
jgi:hypothetical protein